MRCEKSKIRNVIFNLIFEQPKLLQDQYSFIINVTTFYHPICGDSAIFLSISLAFAQLIFRKRSNHAGVDLRTTTGEIHNEAGRQGCVTSPDCSGICAIDL